MERVEVCQVVRRRGPLRLPRRAVWYEAVCAEARDRCGFSLERTKGRLEPAWLPLLSRPRLRADMEWLARQLERQGRQRYLRSGRCEPRFRRRMPAITAR